MEENITPELVLQPNVLGGRFRETEPNRTVAMLYVAKPDYHQPYFLFSDSQNLDIFLI